VKLAVCTSVYRSGLKFFSAYCEGLAVAIDELGCSVQLVLACDGVDAGAIEAQLAPLRQYADIDIATCIGPTIAGVRRRMLTQAIAAETDGIVCYDMDDVPEPAGLKRHYECLASCDISYGDMSLIDENGNQTHRTFYEGCGVPDSVSSVDDLTSRNFMGFSNTAFRPAAGATAASAIPDDVTAVDWWFYSSILEQGHSAQRTAGPVVAYRTHDANILGGKMATDLDNLSRRCAIMRTHFAHLPASPLRIKYDRRVAKLQLAIAKEPDQVCRLMQSLPPSGVWFEEVSYLAGQVTGPQWA
jgi:hypothetical protein